MYEMLSRIFKLVSEFYIAKSNRSVFNYDLQMLSDEELKRKCQDLYEGRQGKLEQIDNYSFKEAILKKIQPLIDFFSHSLKIDPQTVEQVATATEVFKRMPADLPKGSMLFPQQVSAAISLTQRCLVQMDTGEGKTYAILPAAFSLLCRYRKVYIVCANPYLAYRDARRTENFWNFAGFEVGLCSNSDTYYKEWDCKVIYTTLDALIFRHLSNDYYYESPISEIKFGAVILDEADAILLDDGDRSFGLICRIRSDSYNWAFATSFAKQLQKDIDITTKYEYLKASLTVRGEEALKAELIRQFGSSENYLVSRQAVESAYAAIYLAKEGVHYIIKEKRIHPINLINGKIEYDQERNWLFPIEYLLGFPPRIGKVTEHEITVGNFLKLFSHISGASGSIVDDLTEYFFSFQLFTIIIPPRRPRFNGKQTDKVFKTKKESRKALLNAAKDEIMKGRPVLIGVQNITDAEEIYGALINDSAFCDNCQVINLISGKNEEKIAEMFEIAGMERVVTIATQLAGRGVDIRLTDGARDKGGLALFCLEHSITLRHDKQLLGRAGRQGDPFTAIFYVSLEDDLMLRFGGETIVKVMNFAGYQEGEVVEHPMIAKSIARAQRKMRTANFIQRQSSILVELAEKEVYDSFSIWLNYIKSRNEDNKDRISEYCLKWLVDKYVTENIETFVTGKKELSYTDCSKIQNKISADIELKINTLDLEGRNDIKVLKSIKEIIFKSVFDQINEAETEHAELNIKGKQTEKNIRQIDGIWQDLGKGQEQIEDIIFDIKKQTENEKLYETIDYEEIRTDGQNILTGDATEEIAETTAEANRTEDANLRIISYLEVINEEFGLKNNADLLLLKSEVMNNTLYSVAGWEKFQHVLSNLKDNLTLVRANTSDELKSLNNKSTLFYERSSVKIAHRIVFKAWMEYLHEIERDKLRLRNTTLDSLNYNRFVCDELIKDWERLELGLPVFLLKNLLKAKQPNSFDNLFFFEDNRVSGDTDLNYNTIESQQERVWQREKHRQNNNKIDFLLSEKNGADLNLVMQFLKSFEPELDLKIYSIGQVQKTLEDFLNLCPVSSLRSPFKIQNAMEDWQNDEIKRSVEKTRRLMNKKWILMFLKYLSNQKIVSALPTPATKFKSHFHRLKKNISDPKTILLTSQPILFILIFCGLSIWGKWFGPKQLSGLQRNIDFIFFGGLISSGAVTASCFFITLLGATAKKDMYNLTLMAIGTICVSWWQIGSGTHLSPGDIALKTLICLFAVYLIRQTYLVNRVVRMNTGISMLSGWLCFCILFVFFPNTFGWRSLQTAGLFVFFLLYYLWRVKINYDELILLSSLSNSTATLKSEDIRSGLKVDGSTGYMPHLYACSGTLLLFIVLHVGFLKEKISLITGFPEKLILLSFYAIVLYLFIKATLKTRLSPLLWTKEFNQKSVVLIDGNESKKNNEANVNLTMKTIYKKFIYREISFQLSLLVLLYYLFNKPLFQSSIPAFIFLPLIMFVFAENMFEIGSQLFRLLIIRAPTSFEALDLSVNPEYDDQDANFWNKLNNVKYIRKFFAILFAIVGAVYAILDFIYHTKDIIKDIKDLF